MSMRPTSLAKIYLEATSPSISNRVRFDAVLMILVALQFGLYLKTLINFGVSDYHKELALAGARLDYFGCFCMTELSHGSNVMQLQTTATYDRVRK